MIDSGQGETQYIRNLQGIVQETLQFEGFDGLLLTHSHVDHIGGAKDILRIWGPMPVYKYQESTELAEISPFIHYVHDGDVLQTEGATLRWLHTPGHKEDHMCVWLEEEKALFSGDIVMGRGSVRGH